MTEFVKMGVMWTVVEPELAIICVTGLSSNQYYLLLLLLYCLKAEKNIPQIFEKV